MGLSPNEEEEEVIYTSVAEEPVGLWDLGGHSVAQEEEDSGGMSLAWLLVPLVGVGLFAGFLKLSQTKA
jgi:hypothetical protein